MASSKWSLHKFYSKDARFRPYLPDTALFNRKSFTKFTNRYKVVYVKPDLRHGGTGIIQARKTDAGYSFIRIKGKPTYASTADELYTRVRRLTTDPKYIVQQGVPLATIRGRTFDIRSMMMRKPGGVWQFYGFLAKVSGKGSVVNNVLRSGGYILPFEQALRQSFGYNSGQIADMKKRLIRLSHQISKRFNLYKATTTDIGIDFGLDRHGKPWIIEVNFDLPWISLNKFKDLPDRSSYFRMRKMKLLIQAMRKK